MQYRVILHSTGIGKYYIKYCSRNINWIINIFIIQLIFLQQYFPIPVQRNITRYCTARVLLHGCYRTGVIAWVLLHGPWGYVVS